MNHRLLSHVLYINQATLIGGGGILKYPPLSEKFLKIPPSKFWENFSKNRVKLRNLG